MLATADPASNGGQGSGSGGSGGGEGEGGVNDNGDRGGDQHGGLAFDPDLIEPKSGQTLLMASIEAKRFTFAMWLLQAGGFVSSVRARADTADGATALHLLAQCAGHAGALELGQHMVTAEGGNANPNELDYQERPVLAHLCRFAAAKSNSSSKVAAFAEWLVSYEDVSDDGAAAATRTRPGRGTSRRRSSIMTGDFTGRSALCWAVETGQENVAKILLAEIGADATDRTCPSSFALACRRGDLQLVKTMADAGKFNVDMQVDVPVATDNALEQWYCETNAGTGEDVIVPTTPLISAVRAQKLEVAEWLLLERGVDVNNSIVGQYSPLSVAVDAATSIESADGRAIVRLLLDYGANIAGHEEKLLWLAADAAVGTAAECKSYELGLYLATAEHNARMFLANRVAAQQISVEPPAVFASDDVTAPAPPADTPAAATAAAERGNGAPAAASLQTSADDVAVTAPMQAEGFVSSLDGCPALPICKFLTLFNQKGGAAIEELIRGDGAPASFLSRHAPRTRTRTAGGGAWAGAAAAAVTESFAGISCGAAIVIYARWLALRPSVKALHGSTAANSLVLNCVDLCAKLEPNLIRLRRST